MNYKEELKKNFKKLFNNFSQGDNVVGNKSTTYLLPMMGLDSKTFRGLTFPYNQFRSVFIGDKTHDSFEGDKIMLLYKFSGKEEFINYEVFLESLPTYIDKYEPDKYHTMYVYDIPFKWKDDFEKFKQWKPSEFSKDYKLHITKFYGLDQHSPVYQTLYKIEDRYKDLEDKLGINIPRDLEASSSPYWEIEYYQEEFKLLKSFELAKEENGK